MSEPETTGDPVAGAWHEACPSFVPGPPHPFGDFCATCGLSDMETTCRSTISSSGSSTLRRNAVAEVGDYLTARHAADADLIRQAWARPTVGFSDLVGAALRTLERAETAEAIERAVIARAEQAEADADRLAAALMRDACTACGATVESLDAAMFQHNEAVKARG